MKIILAYLQRSLDIRAWWMQLWLAAAFCLTFISPLQAGEDTAQKLDVSSVNSVALAGYISAHIDSEQAIDAKNIDTLAPKLPFVPFTGITLPSIGKSVWFKAELVNRNTNPREMVLHFEEILFDEIEIIYVQGEHITHYLTGLAHPFSSRPIKHRFMAFPLNVLAGDSVLYMRIKSNTSPLFVPHISAAVGYAQQLDRHATVTNTMLGILVGAFGFVTILLFISGASRDVSWCLLFLGIHIVLVLILGGYMSYFIQDNQSLMWTLFNACNGIGAIAALQFSRHVYQTAHNAPKLDSILQITTGISALILASTFYIQEAPAAITQFLFTCFVYILWILTNVDAARKGLKSSGLFLMGTTLYVLSVFASTASVFGSDFYLIFRHAFLAGSIVMAVFYTSGLANKLYGYRLQSLQLKTEADIARTEARTKSEFLAKMSHEIRTPVNGILGMTQLLRTTHLNSTQENYTSVIIRSGDVLLRIINDVLDYSKIEAGKLELEEIEFDLDDMLADIYDLFIHANINPSVHFLMSIDPEVPLKAIGDPVRLQQVLNNLLSNAFKFTQHGRIELRVSVISQNHCSFHLKFEVIDTGIGMTEQQRQRLFSPFMQGDSSMTRRFGGTGLGLSISKQLAQLMGGDIQAQSQSGHGSSFSFDLQLKAPLAATTGTMLAPFNHPHALVFVEESFHAEGIAKCLKYWNVDVVITTTAHEAAEAIKEPFDFIMCATSLHDAHPELDSSIQASKIPVVWMSASKHNQPPITDAKLNAIHLERASLRGLWSSIATVLGAHQTTAIESKEKDFIMTLPMSILIAEDNPINQQIIEGMLCKLGAHVYLTENGLAAYEKYTQDPTCFSLILMDCEMPVLDGFEATKKIREWESLNQRAPATIIALTAHALEETEQLCKNAGMNAVLTKPVRMEDLANTLQQHAK